MTPLSNEEFSELVSADARWQDATSDRPHPDNKISEEDRLFLRDPDNLDRWMDELKATMRKIDSQLTSHKAESFKQRNEYMRKGERYIHSSSRSKGELAWMDFQESEKSWKASASRFKRSVEDRLMEAKQIHRSIYPSIPTEQAQVEIIRLRGAIASHKAAFVNDEPSTDDEVLWKVLDATS